MSHPITRCLTHQLIEDQASPVGLVCLQCKQRLYTAPPQGRCLAFWESQPAAFSRDRRPCFVFTLRWDDFEIRSLHSPESDHDPRAARLREAAAKSESATASFETGYDPESFDPPEDPNDRDWFEDSEFDPREP